MVGPSPTGGGLVPFPDWDDVLADIGDRIRAERHARNWSQGHLAARAGLNRRTVRNLEDGIGSIRSFTQACWGLSVDMAYLLSKDWVLPAPLPLRSLTERQVEVLRVVAATPSVDVAAEVLGMRRKSLWRRLLEIYQCLGVASLPFSERRSAAIRVATNLGFIDAA